MNDPAVFIAGPDRSGTTLLYALLASHPNIAMVRRTNFWRWFYDRYGDLSQAENFERILGRMLAYKRISRLQPDGERIRREFPQGEPSYGRLFALFMRQIAEQAGKPRWGDKSIHTEHYVKELFREFPRAKVIHMTRDPRDRYASVRKRFGKDRPRVGAATARWNESMRAALANRRAYPGQYLVVRYEDLAARPEETAREICAFLDEEFSPAMLSMGGAAEYRDSGGNSSFNTIQPGVISTSPIGRYRTVLTPAELRFIQLHSGRMMTELGYPLESVPAAAAESARFFLTYLPFHSLRMGGWSLLNAYQQRRKAPAPAARFAAPGDERKVLEVDTHV